jgi:hypothetical protein
VNAINATTASATIIKSPGRSLRNFLGTTASLAEAPGAGNGGRRGNFLMPVGVLAVLE